MTNKGYILMLEADEHDMEFSSNHFDAMDIPACHLQQSNHVLPFLNKAVTDNSELPSLILLSMNSVPDNGLEVLQQIKSEKRFKHIPVVILGENTQPELIRLCYAEGASTFINKPFTNKLADMSVKTFLTYWFEIAELAPAKLQYS
jgi:CheY-like chemotaxis protein